MRYDNRLGDDRLQNLSIKRVLAVEENIWSKVYGLKGRVDATVEVRLSSPQGIVHMYSVSRFMDCIENFFVVRYWL